MIGASLCWKNIVLEATDSLGSKNSILWRCCVLQNERDLLTCCAPCSRGALQLAQQPARAGREGAAVVRTGMRGSCRGSAWARNPRAGFCCPAAGSWTRADLGCDLLHALGAPRVLRGEVGPETLLLVAVSEGFSARSRAGLQRLSRLSPAFGGHVARSAQKWGWKAS